MSPTPDPGAASTLLPLLWLAVVAVLGLSAVAGTRRGTSADRVAPILATVGGILATILGATLLVSGGEFHASIGEVLGFVPLAVRYDSLSGAFLVALGLSGSAAALSVVGSRARSRADAVIFPLFLGTIVLVLGASNAFAFLLAWELMALLSAALVIGLRPSRAVVSAGYLYLVMTHVATAAILLAFAIMAGGTGGSLDFGAWRSGAATLAPLARDAVFLLVLVGFGTKAGAIPLHAWLPRAHPVAPAHVSAVMSGAMIKTGIYGLLRIVVDVLGGGPDWWGVAILAIGAASAVLGVLYALMQHDLKRLLAFHSIENIGIILLGLGSGLVLQAYGLTGLATLALAAALFHSINHAVFKTLLFLGSGAVLHATGLRDLNRLGGLARAMPLTALAFGVGAAAISGLPPLNGFASEWLTFQGLLAALTQDAIPPGIRLAAGATMGALALTAALAVACFVKATGVTFLGLPRSRPAAAAHEAPRSALAAMGLLAVACLALGLGAAPVVSALSATARGILGGGSATVAAGVPEISTLPAVGGGATFAPLAVGLLMAAAVLGLGLLIRRSMAGARQVETWTCGIAPQAAFQYSATGFAKPIRLFFRAILQPERQVHVRLHPGTSFPASIRYEGEITLVLEERLFGPAHRASLRLAAAVRRLQNGVIQLYLAYTVVAVLILLLWTRWAR